MPAKYPYKKMAWYPHMGEKDAAIWSRFCVKFPDAFDFVWYDLPIGDGAAIPADTEPNMETDWKILTRYKCDVIGFKNGMPTIIECKVRAAPHAIGQIVCYDLLYQEYIDKTARPDLVIVTDALRTDMDWLCDEFNVKIIVV